MLRPKTITLSFALGLLILITNLQFSTHAIYTCSEDHALQALGRMNCLEVFAVIKVAIDVSRGTYPYNSYEGAPFSDRASLKKGSCQKLPFNCN